MNVLKREKQVLVASMLAEGSSVRAVQRVLGVHPVTTLKLLNRVGDRCQSLMDEHMQNLRVASLELDEAWAFVFKKEAQKQHGDSHRKSHGVVYQTARVDLLNLVERKFLESTKVGREYEFVSPADLGDRLKMTDAGAPSSVGLR